MWLQRYMVVDHPEEDDIHIFADENGNIVDVASLAKIFSVDIGGSKITGVHGGHLTAKIINHPVVHDHVGGYHTTRLNPEQIIAVASVKPERIAVLDSHNKVSLLPTLYSLDKVLTHLTKKHPHHANALREHGVLDNHLTADALTHLATKLKFPQLFPDR